MANIEVKLTFNVHYVKIALIAIKMFQEAAKRHAQKNRHCEEGSKRRRRDRSGNPVKIFHP
jgi:hypothetical protein